MDDRNMWLIPYNKGEDHTILIDLGEQRAISGIKFYNYIKPKYHRRRAPFFQKSSENLATVYFNFELVDTPSICLHVVPKLNSTDGCWALEHETYKIGLSLCRIATTEGRGAGFSVLKRCEPHVVVVECIVLTVHQFINCSYVFVHPR